MGLNVYEKNLIKISQQHVLLVADTNSFLPGSWIRGEFSDLMVHIKLKI